MPRVQSSTRIKIQNNVWLFNISGDVVLTRSGKSITMDDKDGLLHRLLGDLDGSQTIEEIYIDLPKAYQEKYSIEDVLDAINQLDEFKIFENIDLERA